MTTSLAPPVDLDRATEPPLSESPRTGTPAHRGRLGRLVRGGPQDPTWARPALIVLLLATGILYTWDLAASGYANSFYAAAVQSGSQSWKAWFFGSLDSGNSITVDKPPAALWIMGLSAKIFGFNSWSLLVPQALEGVASVGLTYGAVRRVSGHTAALFAGAALALTPAAVLMCRFDNPDALLTLLLTAAGYAVVRALEKASTTWLVLAGSAIGFAFLTKMLQGFLILPVLGLVYLVAAPTSVGRRITQVLIATGAVIVASGWWVLAVALWPASSRPYIGGSTDNSVLELVFGYNGFGRLFGSAGTGGAGGGTAGSNFGGAPGLNRLFSSEMGNEISWLLPAALLALVAGLWVLRRAPRTDLVRASLMLWGGSMIITGLIFSYMRGTIHPYYTVAMAPTIAGTVAIGAAILWRARQTWTGRLGFAGLTVAAGGWSFILLGRVSAWHPEIRYVILCATAITVIGMAVPPRRLGKAAGSVVAGAMIAALLGTGAFGVATAASPHSGSIPSVGPSLAQSASGGMGGAMGGGAGGTRGGTPPAGTGAPGGSTTGGTGAGASSSTALTAALQATTTTWAAATVGDNSAAGYILSSGRAVIAIGGWSGSDSSPTLAQFKAYVAAGQITYFIAGGSQGGGGGGSSGVAGQITAWVEANYTATTIGGQTVYNLTTGG